MFITKLLTQHVSGIIMPIFRRIRSCPTACGVLHCNERANLRCDRRSVFVVTMVGNSCVYVFGGVYRHVPCLYVRGRVYKRKP